MPLAPTAEREIRPVSRCETIGRFCRSPGWDHERFAIHVWRSVRATGETKTRKSRRTLALPKRCVRVLREHQGRRAGVQARTGARWQDRELVFSTATGGQLDKDAVLRAFRKVVTAAGLDPKDWTPREQRHTFVSVLSDEDVPIEKISDLVGHKDQMTTETVYRHQIRPVVLHGAEGWTASSPRVSPGGVGRWSARNGHVSGRRRTPSASSLSGNVVRRSCFRISAMTCCEWSAHVR